MAKAVKRRRNELLEKERADEEERKMCKVRNAACPTMSDERWIPLLCCCCYVMGRGGRNVHET